MPSECIYWLHTSAFQRNERWLHVYSSHTQGLKLNSWGYTDYDFPMYHTNICIILYPIHYVLASFSANSPCITQFFCFMEHSIISLVSYQWFSHSATQPCIILVSNLPGWSCTVEHKLCSHPEGHGVTDPADIKDLMQTIKHIFPWHSCLFSWTTPHQYLRANLLFIDAISVTLNKL